MTDEQFEKYFGVSREQFVREAPTPLEALKRILAHVEDDTVVRMPADQCTLCFSFRTMARAAITKAEKG